MLQLLILLLTFVVSLGTACPTMCTCRHFPRKTMPKTYLYYTAVKCQSFDANTTLDNSTRILEVSNLNETDLNLMVQIMTESDLPFLNNLIVTHSELETFQDCLDVSGEQIEYLSLPYNNLSSIPELCANMSNLISLDLSNNKIQSIAANTSFRTLPSLESLNLSANSLTQIETSSFGNTDTLRYLDLSKNRIEHLENQIFEPLKSLQYLNLSYNRLEVLSEQCFSSLVLLQQLDVSWNRLSCVAPGSLQLPSLSRLLLAGNPKLGKSREVLVGAGGRLQSVDASQTGLKQVPAALTHSIRTLRLAENAIKSVNCGEFDSYPLLQLLDFTSNNLVSIEEDALGRLESLSILYLTDNKIQSIPKSLPEQLTVLHLEFNRIENVLKEDFEGMAKLEVLLLNDNKVTTVEDGAFRHLSSLATLDLSRNPIAILQPGSLAGPTALQVLRLAGVETVSPAKDATFPLSVPDHLITLDLSGSPGLARQLLADTAALAASRELQELNLSDVELEFIRSDLLHYLTQLRIVRVNGNALNCSQLQWLAAWMRRQDEDEYKEVVCASPPDLWGIRIIDLQYKESNDIVEAGTKSSDKTRSKEDKKRTTTAKNKITIKSADETLTPTEPVIFLTNDSQEYSTIKAVAASTEPPQVAPVESSGINQAGKVAISETESTNDRNYPENTPKRNNNESGGAPNKAGAPLNLVLEPEILNNNRAVTKTINKDDSSSSSSSFSVLIDVTVTESASQWNGSTVEMSMYTNSEHQDRLLHPGMLILAAGVLCGAATLTMLAAKCNGRKKRDNGNLFREDIEVASLPSVSELW